MDDEPDLDQYEPYQLVWINSPQLKAKGGLVLNEAKVTASGIWYSVYLFCDGVVWTVDYKYLKPAGRISSDVWQTLNSMHAFKTTSGAVSSSPPALSDTVSAKVS